MHTTINPFITPDDTGFFVALYVAVFVMVCVAYVFWRAIRVHTKPQRSVVHAIRREHRARMRKAIDEYLAAERDAAQQAREEVERAKRTKQAEQSARPVTRRGFTFNVHVEFK